MIWDASDYPVLAHRYLVLNGFAASFLAAFLLNPRQRKLVTLYLFSILVGIPLALQEQTQVVFLLSSAQALILLFWWHHESFSLSENILVTGGLITWTISGLLSAFLDPEAYRGLHHEGALFLILLGVGRTLLPDIWPKMKGHSAFAFSFLSIAFLGSYFMPENIGAGIRALGVFVIALRSRQLFPSPRFRNNYSLNVWLASWLVCLSFLGRLLAIDAGVHMGHAFFLSGIILWSLLFATRILFHQESGPRRLWVISALVILAAATRVSAYYLPNLFESHLAYASLVLVSAVLVWASQFLIRIDPASDR